MTKKAKNRIVTIVALLLLAVAIFLIVQLMMGDDSILFGSEKTEIPTQNNPTVPYVQDEPVLSDVDSKYLWEYGWQEIEKERPSEMPEETTADKSEKTTYNGLLIYNEDNQTGTTAASSGSDGVYEIMTGTNGEVLTDVSGEFVTVPVEPTSEKASAEPTSAFIGNGLVKSGGHKAAGITDGEKLTCMKVYLDDKYDISSRSVMTLTLKENGRSAKTYTYNLLDGTCSLSVTGKYSGMAAVTTENGCTVVTLTIPEAVRPDAKDVTALSAKSTYNTFKDSNGVRLGEFNVSVL